MDIDPKDVLLALGLIVGLIVVVNAGLWAYYRRSNPGQQAKAMRKTARTAQDPWGDENEELKKLNAMVKHLRETNPESKPSRSEPSKGNPSDEKHS